VRLVIADNDDGALDLLVTDLTFEGHDIVGTATHGAEAVDLCLALEPDALVVDYRMPPGINGVEVARQLQELRPHLKVVIYSNYRSRDMAQGAQKAGAVLLEKGNLRALRRALVG
jgi:DNA-binding NarL/FixJ family response regulator